MIYLKRAVDMFQERKRQQIAELRLQLIAKLETVKEPALKKAVDNCLASFDLIAEATNNSIGIILNAYYKRMTEMQETRSEDPERNRFSRLRLIKALRRNMLPVHEHVANCLPPKK